MTAILHVSRLRDWKGPDRASSRRRLQAIKGRTAKVNWAELIDRVASRQDREAFKLLFEHFAPRIKGFLLRTGSNADDAEEIAQATLVAVWRKAGQFDPATSGAAAWIFTISRNLRIDTARRTARAARLEQDAEAGRWIDPVESAETTIAREDTASRVSAALHRLSEEQSRVIRLSFIDERPHAEIASELGIPLGTVKSRIRLAMKRLRDLLEDIR